MPLSLRSVRSKMMMPAATGVLAALVASAVMAYLSTVASARVKRVEREDFVALQFHLDTHALLEREHLALENVAMSGNAAVEALDSVDNVHADLLDRIDKQGAVALGAAPAAAFKARLETYHERAREHAAKAAMAAVAAARAKGTAVDPNAWNQKTPEQKALDAQKGEIEDLYNVLFKETADGAEQARASMASALGQAGLRQQGSIVVGAVILLGFALLSGALSWTLSGRTARPLHALSEVALRIAGGDLTQEVQVSSDDEVGVLASSFRRMSGRLRELVGTLKATSQELAVAAERLSDHTRAQSALLERQAAGVAETSTTTRELEQTSSIAASRAASVLEVAKRAAEMSDQGRQSAERSAAELHRIQGSVDSIVGQSSQLLDQARQVSDIVETVKDLATQSHVLSLNASIEAARAGEAGKSFAVVAQEVRALAEQSGQSAGRIAKMVQDILTAVQSTRETTEKGSAGMSGSLDQIRASGDALRQIGDTVRETSDAALHIASAVQQQSTGIGQIAVAMRDLDKGMEETIGRIRSLELSAQQVAETATRISGIANEFTV